MKTMVLLLVLGIVGTIDLAVFLKLFATLSKLKVPTESVDSRDDLPTVSICISARNETHAMTQCLERVVATEYPKLEVIVLDDGSRDDTSLLIKSFAHAGVRFVEGKPLQDGWLGKNYAQSILAEEASGKILFFMDVDTLIDRHTLSRLVRYMQKNKAKMVSVIPLRNEHWQTSTLLSTMRHFWTLMRYRNVHPRAVSNAWLVERDFLLDQFHSDESLPMSLQMETILAQKLVNKKQYQLVVGSAWLGLRFEKRWSSQVETSIRLLYPQCGRNVLQVFVLVFLLILTLAPYALIWWSSWMLVLIVVQFAIAYYYLAHIWYRYRVIGALLLPLTIAQEIALLLVSAYQYNFGVITWKGRPITNGNVVVR